MEGVLGETIISEKRPPFKTIFQTKHHDTRNITHVSISYTHVNIQKQSTIKNNDRVAKWKTEKQTYKLPNFIADCKFMFDAPLKKSVMVKKQ